MTQLNMVLTEIDDILALLSEQAAEDGITSDRCNGLHDLFYEKLSTAVALRYSMDSVLDMSLKQPVEHQHHNS